MDKLKYFFEVASQKYKDKFLWDPSIKNINKKDIKIIHKLLSKDEYNRILNGKTLDQFILNNQEVYSNFKINLVD